MTVLGLYLSGLYQLCFELLVGCCVCRDFIPCWVPNWVLLINRVSPVTQKGVVLPLFYLFLAVFHWACREKRYLRVKPFFLSYLMCLVV